MKRIKVKLACGCEVEGKISPVDKKAYPCHGEKENHRWSCKVFDLYMLKKEGNAKKRVDELFKEKPELDPGNRDHRPADDCPCGCNGDIECHQPRKIYID